MNNQKYLICRYDRSTSKVKFYAKSISIRSPAFASLVNDDMFYYNLGYALKRLFKLRIEFKDKPYDFFILNVGD